MIVVHALLRVAGAGLLAVGLALIGYLLVELLRALLGV